MHLQFLTERLKIAVPAVIISLVDSIEPPAAMASRRLPKGKQMIEDGFIRREGLNLLHRVSETTALGKLVPRHAVTLVAGVAFALSMTACSGPLSFLPGASPGTHAGSSTTQGTAAREELAYADSVRAARAAVAGEKTKTMRAMTARDIIIEWGTVPIPHVPGRRTRSLLAWPSHEPIDVANYNPSIQEIMTHVVCRSCEQLPYHQMVLSASHLHGVPAGLIHAVIQKESAYNPAATSRKRARGLMQITPGTARLVGVNKSKNLYDPQTNINAGTAYLKYLMGMHDTVDEVLAAYNSGPGNVRKYNGVPPFRETRRYVHDVKQFFAFTSKE